MSEASNSTLRWTLVGAMLLCLSGCIGMVYYVWRSAGRTERLITEIESLGGKVQSHSQPPLLVRFIGSLTGSDTDIHHDVWLTGLSIDDAWLAHHGELRALHISDLLLSNTSLSRDGIRSLLQSHRLTSFTTARAQLTDSDIELLQSHSDLAHVNLVGTPVTARALEILKKHHLRFLGVAGTEMTPTDLESLRSWTGLTGVGIDGLQLTDEAVQVLDDLGVGFVILSGPDVTDLHLMRIAELEAVTHLTLDQTSVTETGIAAFRLACPTCGISVLTEEQIWYQW